LNLKRIAITGPESTGKSWLAEKLAIHFKTAWVPECSREYLNNLGRPYRFEDIAEIAHGQLLLEDQVSLKAHRLLFCDTDMLVTKVWSEFKYGKCDPWILEQLKIHRYDLYLLCDIDLPWEEDPLREHPNKRKELFNIYYRNLLNMKVDYVIISGAGDKRLERAIKAVEDTLGNRH
jgi:NadR type nicotinamide-nucleotide adenylyltransferase